MDRRIRKVKSVGLGEPPLDLLVAAEAFRLRKTAFQRLHCFGGNGLLAGIGTRLLNLEELLDPARFVELKPVGDRVAVNAKTVRRCAPALGLPAFQQEKHLEAALHLSVLLGTNLGIEPVDRLVNLGEVVHGGKQIRKSSVLGLLSPKVHNNHSQLV